jgi:hypothetical protein
MEQLILQDLLRDVPAWLLREIPGGNNDPRYDIYFD